MDRLEIVGEVACVDQGVGVDVAGAPVFDAVRARGDEGADGLAGYGGVEVVRAGDDVAGGVGVLLHEVDGAAAGADDGADEVGLVGGEVGHGDADDVGDG